MASAVLIWWCVFIAARCDLCWWYRVRWSLAFVFASVRMGSCHVVTQERKCKRELSANYVHNYFIRSVFRVHLYSAMYSPPVLSIKSHGLTAWLWLFNPSRKSPDLVRFLWVLIIKICFCQLFCVKRHTCVDEMRQEVAMMSLTRRWHEHGADTRFAPGQFSSWHTSRSYTICLKPTTVVLVWSSASQRRQHLFH
jgi:hypothetical protein